MPPCGWKRRGLGGTLPDSSTFKLKSDKIPQVEGQQEQKAQVRGTAVWHKPESVFSSIAKERVASGESSSWIWGVM